MSKPIFNQGDIVYYVDRISGTYKIYKTTIWSIFKERYPSGHTFEKIKFNSYPDEIRSDECGVPHNVVMYDNRPPELFHTLAEAVEGIQIIIDYWGYR